MLQCAPAICVWTLLLVLWWPAGVVAHEGDTPAPPPDAGLPDDAGGASTDETPPESGPEQRPDPTPDNSGGEPTSDGESAPGNGAPAPGDPARRLRLLGADPDSFEEFPEPLRHFVAVLFEGTPLPKEVSEKVTAGCWEALTRAGYSNTLWFMIGAHGLPVSTPGRPGPGIIVRVLDYATDAHDATVVDRRAGVRETRRWFTAHGRAIVRVGSRAPREVMCEGTGDTAEEAIERCAFIARVLAMVREELPPCLHVMTLDRKRPRRMTVVAGPVIEPGTVVRIERVGDEAGPSGFAEVTRRVRKPVYEYDVFAHDWPGPAADGDNSDEYLLVPVQQIGLRLHAAIGFALIGNDATTFNGFPIEGNDGGVALALQLGIDLGGPLFGRPGLLIEVDYTFAQGSPMKSNALELVVRYRFFLAPRLTITPGFGAGFGLNELNSDALSTVFGSTHTKGRQVFIPLTPSVEFAWRFMPEVGAAIQAGWRFTLFPDGRDRYSGNGIDADVPGVNSRPGGFFVTAGLRVYF